MSLGIIVAMEEELEIVLKELDLKSEEVYAGMKFYRGDLHGTDVVAVVCGIGKVNSAICTQILISVFEAKKVINIGVAGGVGVDIVPGDIVVADSLVQHDVDATAFGDIVGQIPRMDTRYFESDKSLLNAAVEACKRVEGHSCFVGRIATGDQFIADVEKIKWLESTFNALACEMKGGSIAQACHVNKIPFIVIRSISDNANSGAHMDFEKFKGIAVENSSVILKHMLSHL